MADYRILITHNNCRLDKYITDTMGNISRSRVQSLIKSGHITLLASNQVINAARMPKVGEEYNVIVPQSGPSPDFSQCANLDIVHEDEHIVVINKPAGLTVHGGIGTKNDTLVDILLACYGVDNLSDDRERPGIVHRLDKDTSGLMVIAKNNTAHVKLAEAISNRTLHRQYIAVVSGTLETQTDTVNANIAPYLKDKRKMHVVKGVGKVAITHYRVLSVVNEKYSVVECSLETGRTHQIRVHMKHLGHPIIGDGVYGESSNLIGRQALHAFKLTFSHPHTKKIVSLEAKIPEDMSVLIGSLLN